ncbi:MAG TPA: nuclear transport factor 2 family protein [Ramlibacter sp.]|nr:nuclear transport factor 2 family protein [Ramlibacter sp.]
MNPAQTVETYLKALHDRNGALARSLFTADGAMDDYRGRHHAGGEAIERFINQVSPRKLERLSDVIVEGRRATVYGRNVYPDGREALVRWIFHFEGELISHLGNTNVEHVPAGRELPKA